MAPAHEVASRPSERVRGTRPMVIACIVGTRPDAIKLAPVIRAIADDEASQPFVISTGQHRELLDPVLESFGILPDISLNAMRPNQHLADLAAQLIQGIGTLLREEAPDWVVVQGDTTSALSAALAAHYEGVAVAHVEAGLRTRNLKSPFPEEVNRRLAALVADLHFCPTAQNRANLVSEGVAASRVHVVGNTVVDSLLWSLRQTPRPATRFPRTRPRRILLTVHRRENHGSPLREVASAARLLASRGDVEIIVPVHRNPAVRRVLVPLLRNVEGIHLSEPLDYFELVDVLRSCDLVLTDSGGLQEEAPVLGKPVLVLREETERVETIESGVARLVGTDAAEIQRVASELLDDGRLYRSMARKMSPFGDGNAGRRIVSIMKQTGSPERRRRRATFGGGRP
jgi:UDP-N-acetylglucosamine 2-epimerase (non-hydrolysing)